MSARSLRFLLGAALLATLAAALYPVQEPDVVAPAARRASAGGAIGSASAAATPEPTAAVAQPESAGRDQNGAMAAMAAVAAAFSGNGIPDLARLRRSPSVIEGGDPFTVPPPSSAPSQKPRKVATAPSAPAAPPQAPPLPFRMIGSVDEQGRVTVFAERANGDVVTMRIADIVDNVYRVDAINAQTMILTYLPLGQQQTLPLGEGIR